MQVSQAFVNKINQLLQNVKKNKILGRSLGKVK